VPLVALLAALAVGLAAGPALAQGPQSPDYVSQVRRVVPGVPGLEVRMLGGDGRLEIRNPGHHTVVVLGYDGEPFARLLPDGSAQMNMRSPATYLNRDQSATAEVPPEADSRAAPVWAPVEGGGRLEWHDHRTHWMGVGTPPQVEVASARTKIFDYRVPIVVDDRAVAIEGALYWKGRPDPPPPLLAGLAIIFIPLAVGILVLLWKLRRLGRRPGAQNGLAGRDVV
jgi:hypothetical protein